ncbi:MAG: hypothetical protein NWQ37_04035, partial [Marivita lacus]|nr:hypothetical protein [Marivita lacus]
MRRITRLSSCSALALALAGGPAFADLTAQQVWDGLESAMQGFGYSVAATETATSSGLDVTDVVLRIVAPEENSTVEVTMESIALVERGDGSVSMTFPATVPITIDAAPEGEEAVNMALTYTN